MINKLILKIFSFVTKNWLADMKKKVKFIIRTYYFKKTFNSMIWSTLSHNPSARTRKYNLFIKTLKKIKIRLLVAEFSFKRKLIQVGGRPAYLLTVLSA